MSAVRRGGGFRHRDPGPAPREAAVPLQEGDLCGRVLLAVLHHRPLNGDAGETPLVSPSVQINLNKWKIHVQSI